MNSKKIFTFFVLVGLTTLLSWCGKKEDATDLIDEAPSYSSSTKALFPTCNSGRAGYLAYATDETKFYVCDGTSWSAVSITGPTGATGATGADGAAGASGVSVYDKNGTKLGTVPFAAWPAVGIEFSNNGVAMFNTDGTFSNSICSGTSTGYCSPDVSVSGSQVLYTTTSPQTYPKSHVFFSGTNCSGSIYSPSKPVKNSLFYVPTTNGGFLVAAGTETVTGPMVVGSMFINGGGSCTALTVTGNGICCNNGANSMSGYPISTSYSLPTGLTYPFTGPLYFQ